MAEREQPQDDLQSKIARWWGAVKAELPAPPTPPVPPKPPVSPGASAAPAAGAAPEHTAPASEAETQVGPVPPPPAPPKLPFMPPAPGAVPSGDLRGNPGDSRWRRPLFRLALSGMLAAFISALVTLLWLISGLGNFWPMWVWFGCGCALAAHFTVERTIATAHPGRWYVLHEGLTYSVIGIMLAVWLLDGSESFWPGWVIFNLLLALGVHYVIRKQAPMYRAQQLMDRVDELTESRSGALDVQAAELRRIERDLHDGAQARLVALSMQLGRAEARLGDDVDDQTKALIKGAQEDARLAIAELRDLARGIAPPVLTDRGLGAAVEALGKRSPLEVEVESHVTHRAAPVVESAAYFVVAESLTNAAKHSPGCSVHVTLIGDGQRVQVVIADDGVGGADPNGGGLTGLRQRVDALDGTFLVVSPPGRGTTITAELPSGA